MMYGKPAPAAEIAAAQGMAPQAAPDPMAARMINMNPASGLSMMRRPSGPMGGLMEQIRLMNPQQQQSMIASALMPPPQQRPPVARAPMQQMPMMGNLFGLGRGMR